jgi:hypothetical protein
MDILFSLFILAVITFVFIYFLRSNDDENSSIPYVTHGSYPIVGHLFSFIGDRTKFLRECQQRYGQCFKLWVFNQRFIVITSPSDWTAIIRNQSFYFPLIEFAMQIFDLENNYSSRYQRPTWVTFFVTRPDPSMSRSDPTRPDPTRG